MKIKLDENLPDRLVTVFTGLGHDVDTIHAEHLIGRADSDVWSAVQAAQRFLITQDLDFSDMPRFTPGTHAGLLLVRLTRAAVALARQAEDQTHGLGLHRIDLQGLLGAVAAAQHLMFARSTEVRTQELRRLCPLFADRAQEGDEQTGLGRTW